MLTVLVFVWKIVTTLELGKKGQKERKQKTMKKKVITVLLLGTMGATMLTACGDKGVEVQDGTTTNVEVDPAVEDTTKEEKDVTEAPVASENGAAEVDVIQLDPEEAPAEESGEEKAEEAQKAVEEAQKAVEEAAKETAEGVVQEVAPEDAAKEAAETA